VPGDNRTAGFVCHDSILDITATTESVNRLVAPAKFFFSQALCHFVLTIFRFCSLLSLVKVERELRKWALDTGAVRPSQTTTKNEDDKRKTSLSSRIKKQNDQEQDKNTKYSSISKVSVAPLFFPSSASAAAPTGTTSSMVHSLAFLWECILQSVEQHYQQQQEEPKHELQKSKTGKEKTDENRNIHLVAFPHAGLLWDYDQMSTMMMACEFARDQILEIVKDGQNLELTLDLFHPNYKHSPKLWSPDRHSPFPTAGIRVVEKKGRNQETASYPRHGSVPTLGELEALFLAPPALRELSAIGNKDDESGLGTANRHTRRRDILRACQSWVQHYRNETPPKRTSSKKQIHLSSWVLIDDPTAQRRKKQKGLDRNALENDDDDENQRPQIAMTHQHYEYYLYKTVWSTLSTMVDQQQKEQQRTGRRDPSSTSPSMITRMIVASNYHDTADNFQRFAITINAALKRVTNGTLHVTQVFHPNHNNPTRRAPFPMMELKLSPSSSFSKEH
jgi:hypothetical protein